MMFTFEHARKKMKHKIILSFFFNARGDSLEKSTPGMYRSLLVQLLEQAPDLHTALDFPRSTTYNNTPQQWSIELLQRAFEQAVLALGESPLMCFIDALDECEERQIRDMISFFEHLGRQAMLRGIVFEVCFSSRHYPNITISKGLNLHLERQEGHSQDIVSYINGELKIGHSPVAKQIRVDLERKAAGIFMWAFLVVGICLSSKIFFIPLQPIYSKIERTFLAWIRSGPGRTSQNSLDPV